MLSLLLAFSHVLTVDGVTAREPAPLAQQATQAAVDMEHRLTVLERSVVLLEAEEKATRTIANGIAADIMGAAVDLAGTGWALSKNRAESTWRLEEGNVFLGGSKTNASILIGTKVVAMVVNYMNRRKQMDSWKACIARRLDGGSEVCDHDKAVRRQTVLTTIASFVIGGRNFYEAARAKP